MLGRALFRRVLFRVVTWSPAITSLIATWAMLSMHVARVQADEPVPAALHFVRLPGTEDCIDGRTLAQRVDEELGREVFASPASAGIFIEAAASRSDTGYAVLLRMFDAQGKPLGSREVHSEKSDCTELSDTLALVLAVMVDPEAVLSAMASTEKAPEPSPPPAQPAAPANVDSDPLQSAHHPIGEAALFTRGAWGFLPELGVGFGVSVSALALPYVTLRLEGTGYLDQTAQLVGSSGGARLRLLLAGFFACPLAADKGRLGFWGCAGLEAGAMQSQAFGLDPVEKDQTDALVNGAARLSAQVRLYGPVLASLGANLSVPLLRTLYEVTRDDGTTAELFESRAVGVALDLGLAARF